MDSTLATNDLLKIIEISPYLCISLYISLYLSQLRRNNRFSLDFPASSMPDTTKHMVFTSFSSFFIAFHAQTIDFYKFFQFFMASMDIPMASMDSTLATNDLLKITEKLEKLVKNNG